MISSAERGKNGEGETRPAASTSHHYGYVSKHQNVAKYENCRKRPIPDQQGGVSSIGDIRRGSQKRGKWEKNDKSEVRKD